MPRVVIAPMLKRHVDDVPSEAPGATVREVLNALFKCTPRLQGYVLDEQGTLRKHVVVFVNGQSLRDRERLSDLVAATDEVQVFQALTGG